jgi:predicted ester cyclase
MTNHDNRRFVQAKRAIHAGLGGLAQAPAADTRRALEALYAPDAACFVSHPFNELHGCEAIERAFWQPFKRAFPDAERTDTLVAAGEFQDAMLVACLGHYQATFAADWLGIPASHKVTFIRYGEAHKFIGGRIAQSWMLVDLLDVMRQAGIWMLTPSLGAEVQWPAPGGGAGLGLDSCDVAGGAASLALVLAMHAGLGTFDGKTLTSMGHARFWTRNFAWYGPAGIGTTRGLAGFEAHHQIPFLTAFPDRRGGQHFIRIAEGSHVVTGGWPSVTATHTGDGFLGMPATGRRVGMRVMDFYRCENGLIAENWVPIDIIHLLKQIGFDVFERLAHLRGSPRRTLEGQA